MKIENLSDVSAALEGILQRLNTLEKEIAALKGESVPEEVPFDESEAIDLSLDDAVMLDDMPVEEAAAAVEEVIETTIEDLPAEEPAAEDLPVDDLPFDDVTVEDMPAEDIPVEEPAAEPEPIAEPEPEPVSEPEPEPESEPVEEDMPEDFSNLFGSEFDEVVETKPKRGRKPSAYAATTVNEASAENTKAVMDVLAEKSAWLKDIPGAEVRSLRSAIALGDQVLFIRRLFREDSALYQDTIDKLNAMASLKEAVEYLSGTFPEWDTESEDVYRFMMAVRRKIRK